MVKLKKIFNNLISPIQNPLRHIYGFLPVQIRYGKIFWETYNFLQQSQWWEKKKLDNYQMQELSKLLDHVYKNVPYYRSVFNERGLLPRDIQNFDDLKKLPHLTKDILKQNRDELLAKNFKLKDLFLAHTSGTTGKPLQFYQNSWTAQKESAFILHQWSRVGFKPGEPLVQLRGAMISGSNPIEFNPINKVLRLSPRLENKKIVHYYLEKIGQSGIKYLHGYPSAIGIFASNIKQYGFHIPFKLKAIFFASEPVYEWQKQIVKEVFACRVFSHYGLTEKVTLAGECEQSHFYHCLPQYAITEIEPGTNEIIGTSFLNYANPFIRYRTTDIALKPIYSYCDKCKRNYTPVFAGIEGRIGDFIITPQGIPISPTILTHPFKDFETIKGTQIYQKTLDHVKVSVLPWDECDSKIIEAESKQICQGLQKILGPDMKIEVEIIESVELFPSGKFKWIISEVSQNFFKEGFENN